jgi:hypothetical protein
MRVAGYQTLSELIDRFNCSKCAGYMKVHCIYEGTLYIWRYTIYIYESILYMKVYCLYEGTLYIWRYTVYMKVLYIYEGTLYIWRYTVYMKVHYIWRYTVYMKVHYIYEGTLYIWRYTIYMKVHYIWRYTLYIHMKVRVIGRHVQHEIIVGYFFNWFNLITSVSWALFCSKVLVDIRRD